MEQDYEKYQAEDHEVWHILYSRQLPQLKNTASEAYLNGLDECGFTPNEVPRFETINQNLQRITGWQIYCVPGLMDNKPFFELLAQKKFPATSWLRKKSQLDYLEEPDMFHDTFGHIPLLSNKSFAGFLEQLAAIALEHIHDAYCVELLSRLYWYTVEFGLINEAGKLKIYGAGILSSKGESDYAIYSPVPERVPYNIEAIFATPYIKEKFQEKYFVIESYKQLFNSIPAIKTQLEQTLELKSL